MKIFYFFYLFIINKNYIIKTCKIIKKKKKKKGKKLNENKNFQKSVYPFSFPPNQVAISYFSFNKTPSLNF